MDCQNDVRKTISHVDNERGLGVWCTADLKPSLQCQHAVSKAMKVLGLIKRTFKFFSLCFSFDIIQNLSSPPFGVLCPSVVSILGW